MSNQPHDQPRKSKGSASPETPDPDHAGALERHPRFAAARQDYEAWRDSLPDVDLGGPGKRNWRTRCVEKACEILWRHTGRVTGGAVLQMIGFGSSTSINSDIQAWHRQQLPRREAWLDVSDLVASPAVQDAFRGAFQMMLSAVQRESQEKASRSFDAEREGFTQEIERSRKAAAAADDARATAVQSLAEMTARAETAEGLRQRAEARSAELDGRLGATTIALDESRSREAGLRQETDAAIARLEALASGYVKEIERLEGAQKHALTEIEKARADTRQAHDETNRVLKEVAGLKDRVASLNNDLIAAAGRVGEAQAESRMLRDQLAAANARADQLEAQIQAHDEDRRAREKLIAAVRADASRRPGLAKAIQDHQAELEVSGGTLPTLWLSRSGLAITPKFDSVSQLDAFCEQFADDLASLVSKVTLMGGAHKGERRSGSPASSSKGRGKAAAADSRPAPPPEPPPSSS